jgi:hypothetical protein
MSLGLFKVTFFDAAGEDGIGTETHQVLAEDGEEAIEKAKTLLWQPEQEDARRIIWKLSELTVIGWSDV